MADSDPEIEIAWGRVAMIGIIPLLILTLIVVGASIETVQAGHVGVEKGWAGDTTGNTLDEGTHFINPLHSVQEVECRPRTYTMAHQTDEGEVQRDDAVVVQSINGTTHNVDVTIRYSIDCDNAVAFVDRWSDEQQMEQRLIRPDARSDLRDEAANIQSLDIYKKTGRERLANTTHGTVDDNLAGEPATLHSVKVRDVSLPDELAAELESKEQAKVKIETKEHEVQVERREAERKRIEAEADANVTRIRGEAYRDNPIVLQKEQIDAYDNGTVFVIPENSSNVLLQPQGGGSR